ncbi:MAG TPA: tRNA (adenosine(37)-N6)-threonylcarbamoyltransferase complex ATPase subunit type 1 TsaE [Gemmatimonadaceae bacterium]|nr:tRNA (adenosine(37)-N6)-threonylcarbamoyltransferase complex ATPase subunit type 1 TsaE [Gemmatimonadaceae bacterium]
MLAPYHHVVPPLADHGRIALTREELIAWGERFGRAVRAPLVVLISGDLGAGKTTLVQAICHGVGVTDPVTSPTFTIVNEYAGAPFPVYHLDLYRLTSPGELTNIGWHELISAHALVLIEWPERAGDRLPAQAVSIELEHDSADPSRRLLLAG